MSEYRSQLDVKLPALLQAVDNMSGNLSDYAPGFSKLRLKRFFQRFSVLAGRIDKKGARNPQYLIFNGQNVFEWLQGYFEQAINHLNSGSAAFVQNALSSLVDAQQRIERAAGVDPDEAKQISLASISDLAAALSTAEESLQKINSISEDIIKTTQQSEILSEKIKSAQSISELSSKSIADIKDQAEKLAYGDARSNQSLEKILRSARDKLEEIEKNAKNSEDISTSSKELFEKIKNIKISIDENNESIGKIKLEADSILKLSTQAGLATSYLKEASNLETKSNYFTAALYISAIATILVAACYVFPTLEKVFSPLSGVNVNGSIGIALIRITILAPLVYIIFFTNKRINSLETLRMDYAEKAAASLAYFGYRSEMETEQDLLTRLKSSLLLKFAEHPERLLRKRPTEEYIRVSSPGFQAETSSTSIISNVKSENE